MIGKSRLAEVNSTDSSKCVRVHHEEEYQLIWNGTHCGSCVQHGYHALAAKVEEGLSDVTRLFWVTPYCDIGWVKAVKPTDPRGDTQLLSEMEALTYLM